MRYVTRIAPSPTGLAHLGTIRTAYFNWLAAEASGGKFIVRIDDTDTLRSDQFYADQFLSTLSWLGLDYHSVFYQSARQDVYNEYAGHLVAHGRAVVDGKSVCLNLDRIPDVKSWHDSIAGDVKIRKANVKGFDKMCIIKSDGTPTYHFASCVDDMTLGVNYVIRGKDHTTNTAKHALIYDLFNAKHPKYSHVGLLNVKDPETGKSKKLSKRDASSDIAMYMAQKIDPDAMLNFLARMGWGPTVDDKTTKVLSKADMCRLFLHGGKLNNRDAIVDFQQLNSYDRKYKGRKNALTSK